MRTPNPKRLFRWFALRALACIAFAPWVSSIGAAAPEKYLIFDGATANVAFDFNAGDVDLDGDAPKTIEVWAYTRRFDDDGTVFAFGNFGENFNDFTLKVRGGDNEWRAQLWGSDIDFTVPDSLNHWVHFAMVYDGTEMRVYVNGEQVASGERDLDTSAENNLRIGFWGRPGRAPFLGRIADVRMWDVARTQEEIAANMDATLTGTEANLVGYWPMDEGQGNVINDGTSNGRDGVIKGGATWSGWTDAFTELSAPVDLTFGVGESDGTVLLRNNPRFFGVEADGLRFSAAPDGELAIPMAFYSNAGALAEVENYVDRQDFSLSAEFTLDGLTGRGNTRVGLLALAGPHTVEEPFDAVTDTDFYGLFWYPATTGGNSWLEIREGFDGDILGSVEWEGRRPFGGGAASIYAEDFEGTAAPADWTVESLDPDWDNRWQWGEVHGRMAYSTSLGTSIQDNTQSRLLSPVVDLTGLTNATLNYTEWVNTDNATGNTDHDHGYFQWTEINVLDAATMKPLEPRLVVRSARDSDWQEQSVNLPSAILGRQVVFEFYSETDDFEPTEGGWPEGWHLDEISLVSEVPQTYQMHADGTFDANGALELTLTLTDEDGFAESISASLVNPTTGNLFGVGGRLRPDLEAETVFHSFSMEAGAENVYIPNSGSPFDFEFDATSELVGLDEVFLRNVPEDWTLTEDAWRLSTGAADYQTSLAATWIHNFEHDRPLFLESRMTLGNLDAGSSENRVGLVLFGDEAPGSFNPDDAGSYYTFQWIPNGSDGGRIAVRHGMTGEIIAETAFADLPNPPQTVVGATYTFQFIGDYTPEGDVTFHAILTDGMGGYAASDGTLINPTGTRFGFGAHHRAAENPVWDFHGFDWLPYQAVPMPVDLQFGTDAGFDSAEHFVHAQPHPADWTLTEDALRQYRSFPASLGLTPSWGTVLESEPAPLLGFRGNPSGRVETNLYSNDLPTDVTFEAWIVMDARHLLPEPEGTGAMGTIIGGQLEVVPDRWNIGVGRGTLVYHEWGSGFQNVYAEEQVIEPNVPTHVAFVRSGTDLTVDFYVNGEHVGKRDIGQAGLDTDSFLWIGSKPRFSGEDPFWGNIFDVRVWDGLRTQQEIQSSMNGISGDEEGLVAYWPLLEREGTVAHDLSGNGHDGVIVEADWEAPWQTNDYVNSASVARVAGFQGGQDFVMTATVTPTLEEESGARPLQFSGGTAAPELPTSAIPNEATFEAWVRYTDPRHAGNSSGVIFGGHSPGQTNRWSIGIREGTIFVEEWGAPNFAGIKYANVDQIAVSELAHIAVVRTTNDAGNPIAVFYINGVEQGTADLGYTSLSSNTNLLLGARPDAGERNYFHGTLADVRIWDHPRSAEEIAANMNGISGTESGLIAYWPMNEGSGTVAVDQSGNGYDAALTDTEWLTPEGAVNFGEYARFGLSFMGETAPGGLLPEETDFFRTSYRFHWAPGQDQLWIDAPVSGSGAGGASSSVDLTGVASAPTFAVGETYTFELRGTYAPNGSLQLTGTLSDAHGGEAEITHVVEAPSNGTWFGLSSRSPDQQTALNWHTFQWIPESSDEPPPVGPTFADWRNDNFEGDDRFDDAISGPLATPAGDGVPNLLKYAFGLEPLTPVSGTDLPQPEIVDGKLRLTYPERVNAEDINYIPQSAQILGEWNSGAPHVEEVSPRVLSGEFEWVTIEAGLPVDAATGFLRVNVTTVP